jgi:hypothetical protein
MRITAAMCSGVALLGVFCPAMGVDQSAPIGFPLRFHSELIRLYIGNDSLEVDGLYQFISEDSSSGNSWLFYPFPVDSLLGGARMVRLEARDPAAGWADIPFRESSEPRGAYWHVPLGIADTLDIRAVYRQALLADYARYIVTSTKAWREPLSWARFEIHLPAGAKPETFSFPFVRQESDGKVFYSYEAFDFLPDRDITVEWTH